MTVTSSGQRIATEGKAISLGMLPTMLIPEINHNEIRVQF